MREAMRGETGVVINGVWVFTGDALQCLWKSIDRLKDSNQHTNMGIVVETGYAHHPKTGKIEAGFVLQDTVTKGVEGYAESMIIHLGFFNSPRGQVETREFPQVLGQKRIILPDTVRKRGDK